MIMRSAAKPVVVALEQGGRFLTELSKKIPCPMISKHPLHNHRQMTRSKLIFLLADKHPHLPASDVEFVVKAVIDSISNHLVKGGRVEIRGFGSSSAHARSPRLARNPRTVEKVHVPRKYVPHFKPGIDLRERVNIEQVKQWDVFKEIA